MWSLRVVTRSPLVLVTLSGLIAAELYAAYRWLYFPMESAIYLMVIGMLWALLLLAVLAGLIAVSVASAHDAAATGARSIECRSLLRFSRSGLLRAATFIVIAILIAGAICSLFAWINSYSLEVASWLTFRSEKPVAQETAEAVLIWIERFLWVVVLGFLMGFLVKLIREGWLAALRSVPRLAANSCWRAPFLTSLISLLVFGGLACLLINWHPTAPPGFLDFSQVILRNGMALVLTVAGWLFWLLALSRPDVTVAETVIPSPDSKKPEP